MPEEEVVIFTKPGCPYSAAAKKDLQQRGIAFTEYDVLADREARERMLALNGGKRAVPTIVERGQVRVGFHGY